MNIGNLVSLSTPPVALLALARQIATFYGQLSQRDPSPSEISLLIAARIYGHAAGFGGIKELRRLLTAVNRLDTEGIHAAQLLDMLWAGVHVAPEPENSALDSAACLDVAFDQGLRLADPPASWWITRY